MAWHDIMIQNGRPEHMQKELLISIIIESMVRMHIMAKNKNSAHRLYVLLGKSASGKDTIFKLIK